MKRTEPIDRCNAFATCRRPSAEGGFCAVHAKEFHEAERKAERAKLRAIKAALKEDK